VSVEGGRVLEVPGLIKWAAARLEENGVIKPRLNAEILLAHCTGRTRIELYAYPERPVPTGEREAFEAAVGRRAGHEPLQYITGLKGFRYLELAVDPRVLIPRPETEMLVQIALLRLSSLPGHPTVVDVGTGSGCIALSLARECPAAVVHATDICDEALEVAEENALRLGLDGAVLLHGGDLLDALDGGLAGSIDMIVSNPPYVSERDYPTLPPEVRLHEPYRALVAGPLGTEVQLRLVMQAARWLAPGGWLMMEGGGDQMEALGEEAASCGYSEINVLKDLNGVPRVVEMRSPASP
jgi:release factor glutamine methyltransferase